MRTQSKNIETAEIGGTEIIMRRDITQARSELWLRYAKASELARRRRRAAALCVSVMLCGAFAALLPAALTNDGETPPERLNAGEQLSADIGSMPDAETLDDAVRGYEYLTGSDLPQQSLDATDVLALSIVGVKNSPTLDGEYGETLLRAVRDLRLYSSDADGSSDVARLTLRLEDGDELELCVTKSRAFTLDGEYFRADEADALFELLAEAGAEFND